MLHLSIHPYVHLDACTHVRKHKYVGGEEAGGRAKGQVGPRGAGTRRLRFSRRCKERGQNPAWRLAHPDKGAKRQRPNRSIPTPHLFETRVKNGGGMLSRCMAAGVDNVNDSAQGERYLDCAISRGAYCAKQGGDGIALRREIAQPQPVAHPTPRQRAREIVRLPVA